MDQRRFAPATERNRDAIVEVLRRVLPKHGTVLEIASGTGEHVAYFAQAFPTLRWRPSEANLEMHASIVAWAADSGASNILPVLELDVTKQPWPTDPVDAIFNANMVHISPVEVYRALLRGAATHLRPGAPLIMYGPFRIDGKHTAESNAAFDERLRQEDSRWGVRDLEVIRDTAATHGLTLHERVQMPANNQMLIFRRER